MSGSDFEWKPTPNYDLLLINKLIVPSRNPEVPNLWYAEAPYV
jgi:hypothetical protein